MAIQAWGISSNSAPIPIALAANNVFSANPNPFGVYVTVSAGTATITGISINNNGTNLGTSGTFLINAGIANGIRLLYSGGTPVLTTAPTGLTPPTSYPWTEPIYQQFTAQQILQTPGVDPRVTWC